MLSTTIARGQALTEQRAETAGTAEGAPLAPRVRVTLPGEASAAGNALMVDTLPLVEFNELFIYPEKEFKNAKQQQKYTALIRNVKATLPIAKEVNTIIIETYEYLQTLPSDKARREHMKYVEKSIMKEYSPRMKKLSLTQGKLLIKLVDRECSSTSYQLVQAFLGPVRAGFYQAFAWTFGASLKKEYDAEGVDADTERVVRQVEAGQI